MHQLTKLLVLTGGLLFFSCDEKIEKPNNLLSEEQMSQILAEVQIAEAKIGKMSFMSIDSSNLAYQNLEMRIFKKYNTDSATYKKSFNFYALQPEVWADIYSQVVKTLEAKEKKKDLKGI